MVTLNIEFPANRYHATAWGTHVNEGVIEWPPSPWRLLRALIASWHLKESHRDKVSEGTLHRLILKLSETLPIYQIPDTWAGHTRHFMPVIAGKNEKTTKIFDAFLHIQDNKKSLQIQWSAELDEEEFQAFETLTASWNYLGRAESLVIASVTNGEDFSRDCYPLEEIESESVTETGATKQIVRLLAPIPSSVFEEWRDGAGKKWAPADLLAALQLDTADFKKQGWSQPPGSRWVRYLVPDEPPTISPRKLSRGDNRELPTVARFAIVSDVAPPITQALSIGERVHQSLVKWSDGHPVFTGKDPNTHQPLGGHVHAFILPESNNARGTVDFLTIYAKNGFDDDARLALEGVKKTWGYGGHDLQMILLGLGRPNDFGGDNSGAGHSGVLANSRSWESLTPFVPTRHAKATRAGVPKTDPENALQIGSPEHELRRLLKLEEMPKIDSIELLEKGCPARNRTIPCLQFQRQRKTGKGRSAGNRGYAFRINFVEPVQGPIAVGYGSHFGLGLFIPADS